jgi:hypothetical protein
MVKDLAAKIAVNNQQRERGNMRRRVFVPMDEEEFVRWHQPRDDATSNPVHHAAPSFSRPLSGNPGPEGGMSSSSGVSGEGPRN